MSDKPTPGPVLYRCSRCGWEGEVNGRPRCLPCCAMRTTEWRKQNPEKRRELKHRMDKKARLERPELEAAHKRRKRLRNPDHYARKYKERSEWLRTGDVTKEQLIKIYEQADGKCVYCGIQVFPRFHPRDPRGFDHVVPRAKGGQHNASNLVLSCGPCNERKAAN